MNDLPAKPQPPPGVEYVLTVPQSVLFADISLRGTTRANFAAVFGIDYEPAYVDIDNGAMCWNTGPTDPFVELLSDGSGVATALERFIEAAGRTGRALERTSRLMTEGMPSPKKREVILTRLRTYWDVYERHMATLFTFFNMDAALAEAVSGALREAGLQDELTGGLERFLVPSEPNYFMRERASRQQLLDVHAPDSRLPKSLDEASPEFARALELHAEHYGFFLAPFNLGAPPDAEAVLRSLADVTLAAPPDGVLPPLDDLPPDIRQLARLSRQFVFWKTERVDVMALGDARMLAHYREAAAMLDCPLEALFAMRRDELDTALECGVVTPDIEELLSRAKDYCLVLCEGEIALYKPTPIANRASGAAATVGASLQGRPASKGTVTGPVRVIYELSDVSNLRAGEVLVTQMTRPEFGVALDNAIAFVTDEGGRMCHAAIISREMGKPCVIATSDATAVLRDGMVVEVDGTAGTVTVVQTQASS